MADSNKISIRVVDETNRQPVVRSIVINTSSVAALFGPGLLFDSAAMQWAGFISWLICLGLLLVAQGHRLRAMTLEEAQTTLDEIAAKQRVRS